MWLAKAGVEEPEKAALVSKKETSAKNDERAACVNLD